MTLDTLREKTQDMTAAAMRSRAAERFPSTFDESTGGNPAVDLSPFGIITAMFAAFASAVAGADPNDIQGPEDLPDMLLAFIESLPVIGQFVELGEAMLGTYDGTDPVLLAVQTLFAPLRELLHVITGIGPGGELPTPEEVIAGWGNQVTAISTAITDAWNGAPAAVEGIGAQVSEAIRGIFGVGTDAGVSAAVANSGVQSIKAQLAASDVPGGVYFTEPFAYATAAHLPAAYSLAGYGAGAGTYGPGKVTTGSSGSTDQSLLLWKPSGSADRTELYVDTAHPLTTDNGMISATFVKKCAHGAYTYLTGRAGTGAIRAAIGDDVAAIQVVSSGNTFTTAATVAITAADGDVFEFWWGTLGDATLLWLVRNGDTIIDPFSETTHTIGSGNRKWGAGGFAKGLGGFAGQAVPARVGSITVADQAAA